MSALNAAQPLKIGHLPAATDLSTHQFKAVQLGATGIELSDVDSTYDALGILDNAPKAGDPCTIVVGGVVEAVAGGAITQGAACEAGAGGKVVAAADGLWVALETGADDKLITILVR